MLLPVSNLFRVVLFTGSLLAAPLVFAHAHLTDQSPAANAQVTGPVQSLTLQFSEGIEPTFSGLTLTRDPKQIIETGTVRRGEHSKSLMIVPVSSALQSGQYTVDWHVVSVDGHKTRGTYHFTVK